MLPITSSRPLSAFCARTVLCALPLAFSLLVVSGCDFFKRKDPMFQAGDQVERDRKGATEQIAKLAASKTMGTDPQAEATYEEAKENLIKRGSGIQSILFEELATNKDWGVRFGIVHVLSAVGTKRMVEPLIEVLADSEPRVARLAMTVLEVVCNHSEIPVTGEVGANGLPPLPASDGTYDPAVDERLWAEWHRQNASALREAWKQWWSRNAARVSFE